jgi:hypothetical protein
MNNDTIAITVAAFLFVCWLVAWLRSQLRPMPAEPKDYVWRWDREGEIEPGDNFRLDAPSKFGED